MALTGIQIFAMLPGTNCKKCGAVTCLAFAMNLASGKAELDSCPDVSDESRMKISASIASAPPSSSTEKEEPMTSDAGINILLLGKSGAGKSALANYIYGEDVLKTGDGSPVTQFGCELEKITVDKGDYTLNIFDAPGLEPNNYYKWKNKIASFINGRQEKTEPSQWVHGAFYVINVGFDRVEPTEIETIKSFPKEFLMPISVVFTNCDIDPDGRKVNALSQVIKKELPFIEISQVCSVSEKKRSGKITEPFGREALLQIHTKKVAFYIVNRLGEDFFRKIPVFFSLAIIGIKQTLKDSNINIISIIKNRDSLSENIDLGLDTLQDKLENSSTFVEMRKLKDSAEDYLASLDACYHIDDPLEDFSTEMEEILSDIPQKFKERMEKIEENLESGGLFEKIEAVFDGLKIAFTVTEIFENLLNEVYSRIRRTAISKAEECKRRLAFPENYSAEYK